MIELIASALVPIFFVILLGYVAGLSGRVDNKHVTSLNTVVMDFALPAAMFGAVTQATKLELLQQWKLVVILAIGLSLLWGVVYFLQRYAFGLPPGISSILALTVALPNSAATGIPLMSAIFGVHGRIPTVVAISLGSVVLSPLTLIVLGLSHAKKENDRGSRAVAIMASVRNALLSPLILAPLVAVCTVLFGIRVPKPIELSFELLGAAAGGLALLLTGLVLSVQRPRFTLKIAVAAVLVNLGHPGLSWLLSDGLKVSAMVTDESVLLSALPAGFFGILFALRYEEDIVESGSIVAISTVFSLATLSLMIAATQHLR